MVTERKPDRPSNGSRRTIQISTTPKQSARPRSAQTGTQPISRSSAATGKRKATSSSSRQTASQKRVRVPSGNSGRPASQTAANRRVSAKPTSTGKMAPQANKRKSLNLSNGGGNATSARAQMDSNVKKFKIAGIALAAIVAIYLIGALLFSVVFPPGTKLGSFDLSFKTTGDAERTIDDALKTTPYPSLVTAFHSAPRLPKQTLRPTQKMPLNPLAAI